LVSRSNVLEVEDSLDACIDQALRNSPEMVSPQALIGQIWSEKQVEQRVVLEKIPHASFGIVKTLERLSALIQNFAYVPDVVYLVLFLFAGLVPWFFW